MSVVALSNSRQSYFRLPCFGEEIFGPGNDARIDGLVRGGRESQQSAGPVNREVWEVDARDCAANIHNSLWRDESNRHKYARPSETASGRE